MQSSLAALPQLLFGLEIIHIIHFKHSLYLPTWHRDDLPGILWYNTGSVDWQPANSSMVKSALKVAS